jgi:hypothetical protein
LGQEAGLAAAELGVPMFTVQVSMAQIVAPCWQRNTEGM